MVKGFFKNLPKKLEEISDTLGGLVLDGVDTANAASDAIDGVLVSGAIDPIASHLGGILDGLDPKGHINGWVDTIMGGFGAAMGTDGFKEGLENILSNSFLGNFSDETMDTVRDLLKNGVRDSSLAGAVKNMLDSRLSSQIMIGLNRGFFWGGIVTDSMNWLGKGDSLLSTIVRSVGNGYLMDALGSHCPSLGVMELVNFVGFGGHGGFGCRRSGGGRGCFCWERGVSGGRIFGFRRQECGQQCLELCGKLVLGASERVARAAGSSQVRMEVALYGVLRFMNS